MYFERRSSRVDSVSNRNPKVVSPGGGGYSLYSDDRDDRRIF